MRGGLDGREGLSGNGKFKNDEEKLVVSVEEDDKEAMVGYLEGMGRKRKRKREKRWRGSGYGRHGYTLSVGVWWVDWSGRGTGPPHLAYTRSELQTLQVTNYFIAQSVYTRGGGRTCAGSLSL